MKPTTRITVSCARPIPSTTRYRPSAPAGTEQSDLDILIDPTPQTTLMDLAAIEVELERLLVLSVDVLTPKALPEKSRNIVLAEAKPV